MKFSEVRLGTLAEKPVSFAHREATIKFAFRPLDETLAVGAFVGTVVKFSRLAVAGNAVALDITKMQLGRLQPLPFELYDPGFDDDPAHPKAGIAVARGQHPPDASTPTE